MAFPTSSLTNNQVHKEGNRAFVYDSALGVWDQVRETEQSPFKSEELTAGYNAVPGASWVKLSEVNASNNGSIDIGSATIFSSTYSMYVITITDLLCQSGGNSLRGQFFINGTRIADGYRWTNHAGYYNTHTVTHDSNASLFDVHVNWHNGVETGFDVGLQGVIWVANPAASNRAMNLHGETWAVTSANTITQQRFAVFNNGVTPRHILPCTGIQFFQSSGNIVSGKFVIYGIKD